MVYFHNKNSGLGIFWSASEWKMLVYFMLVFDNFRRFGIINGHLVYFPPFWYVVFCKIWQPFYDCKFCRCCKKCWTIVHCQKFYFSKLTLQHHSVVVANSAILGSVDFISLQPSFVVSSFIVQAGR
jgi:hypothetical protein